MFHLKEILDSSWWLNRPIWNICSSNWIISPRFTVKIISKKWNHHKDVSKNSGIYPQIIHFNRVFHYKPSILGYPYFWKHPPRIVFSIFPPWFNSCNSHPLSGLIPGQGHLPKHQHLIPLKIRDHTGPQLEEMNQTCQTQICFQLSACTNFLGVEMLHLHILDHFGSWNSGISLEKIRQWWWQQKSWRKNHVPHCDSPNSSKNCHHVPSSGHADAKSPCLSSLATKVLQISSQNIPHMNDGYMMSLSNCSNA